MLRVVGEEKNWVCSLVLSSLSYMF